METNPGLQRIICIDAHIAGKRMEVKLPHHANISGSNGSGKTTLLKLVPFFYGATPGELVERVGKKANFTDYYLSRPTSLIVFEYMTRRGLKCVVVYRHTTGLKPAYRFLDERFAVEYVSEERDGKPVFVEGRNLGRHWTSLRLTHSNQLDSVVDYRAVIQGDRSLISQSAQGRELSHLVAMYSLGGRVGSMGHINKMTAAILFRRGSMEGIKQMIAEIMREDQIELPPLNLHKNVRDVVAELSVLRNLDKNEALFREVVSLGVGYLENAFALQNAGAELWAYAQSIKERIVELGAAIEQNRELLRVLIASWEDDSTDIKSRQQDARLALEGAERQLNKLEQEYRNWGEQDILRKKADYENLGEFADQLADARQRLRTLEEGISDLKQHYDELIHQEHLRHNDRQKKLTVNKMRAMQEKNAAEMRWMDQLRSIESERHQAQIEHSKKRAEDTDRLSELVQKARFAAENTLSTEEEKLALAAAEGERDHAETCVAQANEVSAQAGKQVEQRRAEEREAERALSSSKNLLDREIQLLDGLRALCSPKPGSLLSELREKDPDWHDTIGKVMREDLLHRQDLSPVYVQGSQAELMGWSLNLEKLDKPEWASSLAEQERRLAAQDGRVDLAEQQLEIMQSTWNRTLAALKAAQDDRDEANRRASQAVRKYESAKDAVRAVKNNNKNAADERRLRAKESLAALEQEMIELKRQIKAELVAIEERFRVVYAEAQGQQASDLSLLDEALEIVESDLLSEKQRHQTAELQLQQEFKTQCAARGMDDKVMDAAVERVKRTREDHDRVSGYRKIVQHYDDWIAHDWPRRSSLEADRIRADADTHQLDAKYKDAERKFKHERDQLNRQHSQYNSDLRAEKERHESCVSMLKKADIAQTTDKVENLRPLDTVLLDTESLLAEQQNIIRQVRAGIGKVESVIASQGEHNQIAEAWLQLKRQAESKLIDGSNTDLLHINLTQSLEELLRVHLPQKKETIESFVRTISDQLADFYVGLKKVSLLIKQQSRDISTSISAKQYFAAIGSIGVSLNSRIDSQDYWPHLEAFERVYREWKNDGERGLPPKALDELLISVTDILHRSRVATGIESVFDLAVSLEENGRVVTATNSRDLENASSNGLSYLILCSIFAGITRMLCKDKEIRIHWPVDELGVIDAVNVASLFSMLNDHNIVMVGGFPTTDPLLLQHFTDRHEMRKDEGIVDIHLPEDKLSELLAARRRREQTEGFK